MISVRHVQSGNSSFYGFDPLGNTRLLTSSAGAITDTYGYKAFGEELSSSGSTPSFRVPVQRRRQIYEPSLNL